MRKVICFLGKTTNQTQYRWMDGSIVAGRVFAEVLLEKETFDQMLVFVTAEAQKTAFPILEEHQDRRVKAVNIPDGKSEDEIWKIFNEIIARVDEGDEIVFDITHGFRSLPFLTFLFAAYLKTARQAKIQAVYYGALEMRENKVDIAPVLDLSHFVEMLDWITATDQFIETGDARRLTSLLQQHSNAAKNAAEKLAYLSQASALCQPFSLGEEALELPKALGSAADDFATTSLPFTILGQRIEQRFTTFALPKRERTWRRVQQEYELIEWYFEHQQASQALTLMRECLTDMCALRLRPGEELNLIKKSRDVFDYALTAISHEREPSIEHDDDEQQRLIEQIRSWPEFEQLKRVINNVSQPRNQINHAEHQNGSMGIKKLIEKAETVRKQFQELYDAWPKLQ